MPTTNNNIIVPSIGIAWTLIVAQWSAWVQDDAKSVTFSQGDLLGQRFVSISFSTGPTSVNNNYILADIKAASSDVPIGYIATSPGWRAMPGILNDVYGGNDTLESWRDQVLPARAQYWATLAGITAPVWTHADHSGTVTGVTSRHSYAEVSQRLLSAMDAGLCTVVSSALAAGTVVEQGLGDGLMAGVVLPAMSAGGQQDLSGVIAALNDIALIDVDYTANNGGAIFSLRGKVRVG